MDGALTLVELDQQVATIGDETRRRLRLVVHERRYGDWDALARSHREMLAILRSARIRLGELQPFPDRAVAYRLYLDALDRQLVLEQAVLAAAEAADMDAFRTACRTLALALDEIQAVGLRAGLRSTRTTLTHRARTRAMLPWALLLTHRHARAEHRAGRRWQ
jgi:hypothetical protein